MPAPEHIVSTIRSQVYSAIKENICNGCYEPGQRLGETELAESLQVSRSPVREALRRLAADGLVEEKPNRGVFVRQFTPRDIEEIFDVRVLLESYCILHSPQSMTIARKEELLACLQELTLFHSQGDMQKYIEADCKLHWLIVQLGGNRLVESLYQQISAQTQQFRSYSLVSRRRFQESLVEHTTVVHCLLTGNVEEADRINRRHLELARDKINEYLISKQTNQPLE